MGLILLVLSLLLVFVSVVIMTLREDLLTKLNLDRKWARIIGVVVLIAGLWVFLHYLGEKTASNLLKKFTLQPAK